MSIAFLKEVFGIISLWILHTGIIKTTVPMGLSAAGATSNFVQEICKTCGGSGMLREGADSYRTCLSCLGLGVVQRSVQPSPTTELVSASTSAGK